MATLQSTARATEGSEPDNRRLAVVCAVAELGGEGRNFISKPVLLESTAEARYWLDANEDIYAKEFDAFVRRERKLSESVKTVPLCWADRIWPQSKSTPAESTREYKSFVDASGTLPKYARQLSFVPGYEALRARSKKETVEWKVPATIDGLVKAAREQSKKLPEGASGARHCFLVEPRERVSEGFSSRSFAPQRGKAYLSDIMFEPASASYYPDRPEELFRKSLNLCTTSTAEEGGCWVSTTPLAADFERRRQLAIFGSQSAIGTPTQTHWVYSADNLRELKAPSTFATIVVASAKQPTPEERAKEEAARQKTAREAPEAETKRSADVANARVEDEKRRLANERAAAERKKREAELAALRGACKAGDASKCAELKKSGAVTQQ